MLQTDQIADTVANAAAKSASGHDWELLKSLSLDQLLQKIVSDIVSLAFHICLALLVFYVGKFILRKIYRLVERMMMSRNVDLSLTTFVLSLTRIVLYFILIVMVISILGIETSSFIALFASAGVAIGMALSGTLQNFAGGVLILLLKPYKIGDYIETQGYAGTVTEVQIFNTIICTPDNKSIIIPNGGLSTGTINNWSREDYRRIEWNVAISYGDNVEAVRKHVLQMFESDPDIVTTTFAADRKTRRQTHIESQRARQAEIDQQEREKLQHHSWLWRLLHRKRKEARRKLRAAARASVPKSPRLDDADTVTRSPMVAVGEMADSSVNLIIRAWAPSALYWDIYFRYNERFYSELPAKCGITFPFPQIDVHMTKPNANP